MSNSTRRSREVRGKKRWPARALALFALIVIGVYALVFFTGNRTAEPKLGIDLQGGTRITLIAKGDVSTASLEEARGIIDAWESGNGSGVVTYHGRMIENLHVDTARRALAMTEAIEARGQE